MPVGAASERASLLLAFAAGSVAIICIRLIFSDTSTTTGAVVAAVVASAVVGILGLYYAKGGAKQGDRAGDNLYYLGLLLTLVSLIYTLVVLFVLDNAAQTDDERRVEEMIGSFGIALVSTVAGILGRILLQDTSGRPATTARKEHTGETAAKSSPAKGGARAQRAATPKEIEATAEALPAVDESLLRLRRDLRSAADAFAHFTRVTLSHGENMKAHAQERIESFNEHIAASTERKLQETTTTWNDVAQAIRATGEDLLQQTEANLAAAVDRANAAWTRLADQTAATTQAAEERLNANGAEMATTLQRLASASEALATLTGAAEQARAGVSTLGEAAAESATASHAAALNVLGETASALTEAMRGGIADQLRAVRETLAEMVAVGRAQREQSEQSAAAMRQSVNALADGLETAQANLAKLAEAAALASAHVQALKGRNAAARIGLDEHSRQGAGDAVPPAHREVIGDKMRRWNPFA